MHERVRAFAREERDETGAGGETTSERGGERTSPTLSRHHLT